MPGATLGPRPAYLPTPSHHLGLSLKKSTPKTKLTASTMCFCCPCFSLCTSQYHMESDAQSPSSSIRSGTKSVSFTAEPLEPSTVPGTQCSTNTLRDFNKSGDDRFQLLAKPTWFVVALKRQVEKDPEVMSCHGCETSSMAEGSWGRSKAIWHPSLYLQRVNISYNTALSLIANKKV